MKKICFVIIALFVLASCKTKYVPVIETHTETIHHYDSVKQIDSVFNEKTTLIREVDSATMAQYGIQIKSMEKAWLIQSDKLQKEISRLESQKVDSFVRIDSVPKIVIKEVEKKQTIKQRISEFFVDAIIAIVIVGILVIFVMAILRR